ncbi:MAG: flagellar export chaperone FlgN [Desulfobacteraceae bacterium]|nr:flagellar export chaperone FlgN [Desulfobacteraceae bacterium]
MANHEQQISGAQDVVEGLGVSLKLSQDLFLLLADENAALRAMATQELFRISRQKMSLLARLNYLDEVLGQLLPAASSSERERLIGQYKRRIREVRAAIQDQNLINKRLTEDTLGYLNDAIALITRPAREESVYRAPGRLLGRNLTLPSVISRAV